MKSLKIIPSAHLLPLGGLICLFLTLSSCTSLKETTHIDRGRGTDYASSFEAETRRLKAVEAALNAVGQTSWKNQGVQFNQDCSGTVGYIMAETGIDTRVTLNGYSGNLVKRFYDYGVDNGLYYETKTPRPGDVIIFDKTYDKNGNGRSDKGDELSHTGIVVSIDEEGTIEFVHYYYVKGTVKDRMNLFYPEDKSFGNYIVNSDNPEGEKWMSECVRGFLRMYEMESFF